MCFRPTPPPAEPEARPDSVQPLLVAVEEREVKGGLRQSERERRGDEDGCYAWSLGCYCSLLWPARDGSGLAVMAREAWVSDWMRRRERRGGKRC